MTLKNINQNIGKLLDKKKIWYENFHKSKVICEKSYFIWISNK